MARKPTYEELEQGVGKLKKDYIERKMVFDCWRWWLFLVVIIPFSIFTSAVAQDDVHSRLLDVTAAVPRDFPPQYFLDESGRPVGFAIDVMEQIATIAGLRVSYLIEDSWTKVAEAVKSGRADLIPNLGITALRKAWVDYTAPVETFPVSIFVRKQTYNIKGVEDLSGRKVAAVKFNVGVALLQSCEGIDLEVFNDVMNALFGLLSSHVDALVYPTPVLKKIAREARVDHRIKIVGEPLKEIKRAVAVRKGDAKLLERLNRAINRFVSTEDYQRIYAKWYGKPRPFWTASRVALVMSGLFLTAFAAMVAWKYYTTIKLNRRLVATIAERKQGEQALKESEERFRTMMEQSPIAIQIMTTDGRIVQVNDAYERLWEITLEDLKGYNILRDEQAKSLGLMPYIERGFAGEALSLPPFEYDPMKTKTVKKGRKRWIQPYIYPANVENGEIRNVIMMHEDITERKQAEEALHKTHDELEANVEERTKNLKEKTEKLQRMNTLFVNRELRMKELKEEINELKSKIQEEGKS